MPRSSGIWVVTTVVGVAISIWLYLENRALKDKLGDPLSTTTASAAAQAAPASADEPHARSASVPLMRAPRAPELPAANLSWLDRRLRRQQELTTLLGRGSAETDDEYRARIVPLVKAGLAVPRQHAEEMRKAAEDKAHVTAAQSQQLDQAVQKTFSEALAYTNKAVADGTVSPYEQNIASLLEFGGGLGAMLQDSSTQISRILTPEQMRAMADSGFDWSQYLGVEVPWEQLSPPPPPKP